MGIRFLITLLMMACTLIPVKAETEIQWLNNRFRVDAAIERITFMIHREAGSPSVVLVQPDGKKYYYDRHPAEAMEWYQTDKLDIVTIASPMAGPWQAIGKVDENNRIKLITNLSLTPAPFPMRLYQGEVLKYTAVVTDDSEAGLSADFLKNLTLSVKARRIFEGEQATAERLRNQAVTLGEFADDGSGLDEFPNDGIFTVALPISLNPGRYMLEVSTGNGLFMRTEQKEIRVYPSPIQTTFMQSQREAEPHTVTVGGLLESLQPGSLAVHVEQMAPHEVTTVHQAQSADDALEVHIALPRGTTIGRHQWLGWVYATDLFESRELVFALPAQTYVVQGELQLERQIDEYRQAREKEIEQARIALEAQEERDQQKKMMLYIGIGNAVMILLAVVAVVWSRRKRKPPTEA